VHALIGTEDHIVVPEASSGVVQPEGQLAGVIGQKARRVSKDDALEYILGDRMGHDSSQRPWQQADRTMFRTQP
jgi:2-keto-4-pentenoate hydratase/2-oxohepta-3-ene-1,7-dioic acid hydratase in catechol pathway